MRYAGSSPVYPTIPFKVMFIKLIRILTANANLFRVHCQCIFNVGSIPTPPAILLIYIGGLKCWGSPKGRKEVFCKWGSMYQGWRR